MKSSFAEKALGFWGDIKLNKCQEGTTAGKKANDTLGCIRQFWASYRKSDMDILERVPQVFLLREKTEAAGVVRPQEEKARKRSHNVSINV